VSQVRACLFFLPFFHSMKPQLLFLILILNVVSLTVLSLAISWKFHLKTTLKMESFMSGLESKYHYGHSVGISLLRISLKCGTLKLFVYQIYRRLLHIFHGKGMQTNSHVQVGSVWRLVSKFLECHTLMKSIVNSLQRLILLHPWSVFFDVPQLQTNLITSLSRN